MENYISAPILQIVAPSINNSIPLKLTFHFHVSNTVNLSEYTIFRGHPTKTYRVRIKRRVDATHDAVNVII